MQPSRSVSDNTPDIVSDSLLSGSDDSAGAVTGTTGATALAGTPNTDSTHNDNNGKSVASSATPATGRKSGGTRKAALLVTSSTGISALIGVVNGLISARLFGVSRAMDAYLVAVILPQLLGFIFGIRLSVFLVPWLISLRHAHGPTYARRMEWRIALLFPAITALILALCLGLSGPVVHLLAPGFKPDEVEKVVSLLRWTVPGGVAVVAMAILTSIAHSHQRFAGASLAGIINPLATFVLLVTLGRHVDVAAIAMGFFLGPLLGCIPILWSLRGAYDAHEVSNANQSTSKQNTSGALRDVPAFHMVFLLGLMTTAHNQIPLIVSRNLGSRLGEGVIAGLQYASTFSWMPVTILATSVGTALLPALAEKHQASKDGLDASALEDAARAIRVLAYLLVPLAFVILFFAWPVVSLALSGGEFDKEAVEITSGAMQCYMPLIWIGAIWAILLKVVQARNALNILFEALLLGTIVDVLTMIAFHQVLGYRAIPLAGSANYLFVTVYVLVRTRNTVRLPLLSIGRSLLTLSALSLAMCGVVYWLREYTPWPVTGVLCASLYVGLAHLLHVREQDEFWTLVLGRKLKRFIPQRHATQTQ